MSELKSVASEALTLQKEINKLTSELDNIKDHLREIANGEKKEILIEGEGKILISTPRGPSEKSVVTLNLEKLEELEPLKIKLFEKGIIKKELKKTPAAKASVSIKPNV